MSGQQVAQLTPSIHRYLTAAPTSHFLGQPVEMVDAWEGRDNLLWRVRCRGQDAVLKLYLDAGQARSRRQYDGQQLFAADGLAPRPLWYDRYPTGLSRQVLIYEWVPGQPVDARDDGEMVGLAQAVAALHRGDVSQVRRFCPHPVNLDFYWRIEQGSFAQIHAWLDGLPAPELARLFRSWVERADALVAEHLPLWQQAVPTPVHGDLKLENCLAHRGQTVLVDWEMFGLGDPALEVARFLHHSQADFPPHGQERWLDSYLAGLPQPALDQRIQVYRRLLPFHDVCYLLLGLQSLEEGSRSEEAAASRAFLQETLAAALIRCGTALEQPVDEATAAAWAEALFQAALADNF